MIQHFIDDPVWENSRSAINAQFQKQGAYRSLKKELDSVDPMKRIDCTGDVDLRGFEIKDLIITDLDFSGINLECFVAKKCTFIRCNFSHCSLVSATFERCTFQSCSFNTACLINANFSECNIKDTNFDSANLFRISFSGTKLDKIDAIFSFDNKNFMGAFRPVNFSLKKRSIRSHLSIYVMWCALYFVVLWLFSYPERFRKFLYAERSGNFRAASDLLKQVRVALGNSGNRFDSRIAELYSQRAELHDKSIFDYLKWTIRFLFGFLLNSLSIVIVSIFVIFVFAVLYTNNDSFRISDENGYCKVGLMSGAESENTRLYYANRHCRTVNGNFELTLAFPEALYFSAVTFATLGYGDIVPKKGIFRNGHDNSGVWMYYLSLFLPALQAFLGAIFLALLVAALVRSNQ